MTAGVKITTYQQDAYAECDDCPTLHPGSTRERARQHVKKSGHTARVIVPHVTKYEPIEEGA